MQTAWLTSSAANFGKAGVTTMNKWMQVLCALSALALSWPVVPVYSQDRDSTQAFDENDKDHGKAPRRPLTEDEMVEQRQRELLLDFKDPPSLDHGESVHPRLMETVKDNTVGVRFEEREAYLRVLRLASEVPLRRQEPNAEH
jgi:hypothetical protein